MENSLNEIVWKQFGAAIDMLENAILACPIEYWNTDSMFWYNAYHCLFFLDYYLTSDPQNFHPPIPFTLSEFEDRLPDQVYTAQELIGYLSFNREKLRSLLAGRSANEFHSRWVNASGTMNYSVLEILLYNLRHVQHHTAQLNLLLRLGINDAPDWVSRTDDPLSSFFNLPPTFYNLRFAFYKSTNGPMIITGI